MRLSVMRLSEKPQTVKAERPDDRLLGIGFDGCRLGGCPEKPKTVKAKRPDDRLLRIGEVEMNSGEQKLQVLHFGNQLTKISI